MMNTYTRICCMIPTYKRVWSLKRIVDSAYLTASDKNNIVFSFCVNTKDEETRDFLKSYGWPSDDCYEIIDEKTIQPNLSLYFNLMYDNTRFKDAIVTELGDDMIFQTLGWDKKILEEINAADGKLAVYCDDAFVAHEKCCVNLFTTREVVDATKKPFMCEFFHADMIDMVWFMVGNITGTIKYLPDVIIEHDHNTKKEKDDWDSTFKRLAPIQKQANAKENVKLAVAYATLCARNMIESGVGKWNTLQ